MAENQTTEQAEGNNEKEAATASGQSRLVSFILMGVVAVMAVSTIGYMAINATQAQEQAVTEAGPDEDLVIARIGDREYTTADLEVFVQTLPPQLQQLPLSVIYPSLIEQFVSLELVVNEAYKQGLESDPEVVEALKVEQDRIVREIFLDRYVETQVTEESIDDAYNEFLFANPTETEVRARHILVDTAEEATALIARLDGGADFAELAREASTGPSSEAGGDLGFFSRDRMVKPFSDAAFELAVGDYTKTPVETQFGFHVILVEERRDSDPPTKEQVRDQLFDRLASNAVQAYFRELQAASDVEMFDLSGEPVALSSEEEGASQ
ncbi:MAG: peptidylprolyl isomerase [Alphaproteobacteria bacterium]|nr:peptidylprolyl isomerase [Alphaproteobacteria bacterium SS10]